VKKMEKTRIALVTGANKGLGLETSRQLARKGIKVLVGSRSVKKGKEAVKKLRQEGLDAEFIHLDVTKPEHIKKAARTIEDNYGRLDILVNNAGMAHPEEPLFANTAETVSPRALRDTFAVNFFGLVELTQAVLPLIRKSDAGRIVNVASILGSLTIHSSESDMSQVKPFAYDASKTAVNAFTIHLAAALKGTPVKEKTLPWALRRAQRPRSDSPRWDLKARQGNFSTSKKSCPGKKGACKSLSISLIL